MKSQEIFAGFSPEVQAGHEQYLINRFGKGMQESISKSKNKVKHWKKADWENSGATFNAICQDLFKLMNLKQTPDSAEAQSVIRRHYEWLKSFWTPTHESYAGHASLIVDSELRKAYEVHDPKLPEFAAAAMKAFAERDLA
jgi:hypothetical protein